ncbi:MAG: NADPH:quinone oxidoreductase family protein [Tistlia sp.]|uniref:NADPH:quinone oxidoreductase family protein n=1 Tax=Tistlia sp. TaxID=3057121 RepID=UPI0034A1E206
MRAVVVGELNNRDSIGIGEVEAPTPGDGEVLVQVGASSVNFPDILMLDGKYQIRPTPPFVLGKEAAGTVAAVGAGVTRVKPGERVLVQVDSGGFAEQVVAPERAVFAIPDDMDFETAAAMGLVYQTAWLGLVERGRLQAGEAVLVNGASGGVGMAAVELAAALGAEVLAGLTTPAKAATVEAAGARHVVDLSVPDLKDALRSQVAGKLGGRGLDLVLDMIGGEVFEASLRALAFGGRAVVIGFAGGNIPTVRTNYLLLKNIAVLGSTINGYLDSRPEVVVRAQEEVVRLWREGKLKPNIMRRFSLGQAREALAAVEKREVVGKVVITF